MLKQTKNRWSLTFVRRANCSFRKPGARAQNVCPSSYNGRQLETGPIFIITWSTSLPIGVIKRGAINPDPGFISFGATNEQAELCIV